MLVLLKAEKQSEDILRKTKTWYKQKRPFSSSSTLNLTETTITKKKDKRIILDTHKSSSKSWTRRPQETPFCVETWEQGKEESVKGELTH
jgi:hypothetical protein